MKKVNFWGPGFCSLTRLHWRRTLLLYIIIDLSLSGYFTFRPKKSALIFFNHHNQRSVFP